MLGMKWNPALFTFLYMKEAEKLAENQSHMEILTASALGEMWAPCCKEASWSISSQAGGVRRVAVAKQNNRTAMKGWTKGSWPSADETWLLSFLHKQSLLVTYLCSLGSTDRAEQSLGCLAQTQKPGSQRLCSGESPSLFREKVC